MIPYGLFSQIMFLLLSIALVFTYIKPALTEIDSKQDKLEIYIQEIDKVSLVNSKLAGLMSSFNNVSQSDRLKLLTYMPDEVDTIAIPRDLSAIAGESGVILRSIKYSGSLNGPGANVSSDVAVFDEAALPEAVPTSVLPEKHGFAIAVEGSYSQVKSMLKLMEENAYPIEVHEMKVTTSDGGFLNVDMEVVTYDRTLPVPTEVAIQ